MCLTIKEAIAAYIEGCKTKKQLSASAVFGKAIFAGIFIAMGAAASSVAAHSVDNVGLARLAAAVVFPVGLMMVILMGAELFTGDCLMAMAVPDGHMRPGEVCKFLLTVFVGNFLGALLLATLIIASGQLNYSGGELGAYTIKVALAKVSITPIQAVSSGICCNILVCAAVLMALCAKDVAGKIAVSFFVIMLFVTAGFEHCVANMYYITAGILAKSNAEWVAAAESKYAISAAGLEALNVKAMLFNNLLPVTIGNILGGIVFVGLPMFYLNANKMKNASAKKKEETAHGTVSNNLAAGAHR